MTRALVRAVLVAADVILVLNCTQQAALSLNTFSIKQMSDILS